ncbi:CFEM domain-containing protein [Colletotrichum musicola]|uniref:CFEM domain-containing protein n=1 Tax=Colletotrichum musicola TaxID=2175873 RepID=A0A8H6KS17_9PEZI|nr:CFEM domain-containing protein [Colletotrichum musicola]
MVPITFRCKEPVPSDRGSRITSPPALSLGLGKDIWTLRPEKITQFLKLVFVTQIFYISGLCLIKASIIFFYLRIFPSVRFRRVVWATQGFNILLAVLYLILTFTQCDPLPLYWTGWDGQQAGACRDFNKLVLSHVGFNMALDVWMLALPLTQLYKLNMRLRKKIGIILMFSVGIFLTAVSAIRIQTVVHFATTNNITSEALWVYVWSFIELCVGVFVACMPTAGQLWRSVIRQAKTPSTTSSTKSQSKSAGSIPSLPKRKTNSQDVVLVSTHTSSTPIV